MIGREATGRFMELLLGVVPRFSTTLVAAYPTADPNTVIIESHGGGPTIDGGRYCPISLPPLTQGLPNG